MITAMGIFGARISLAQEIPQTPAELTAFKKILVQVQQGVAENNPEKVAAVSNFPKFAWEDQNLGDDLSKDTFLKNFSKMFTPEIKTKLAGGKYHRTVYGDYGIEWARKNNDYILLFTRQSDGSYQFGGLAVGPAD